MLIKQVNFESKSNCEFFIGTNKTVHYTWVSVGWDSTINTLHNCSKIPKISPGAYIFSKALFEGLLFGGAYLWREICVQNRLGYPYSWKEIYHLHLRAISKYKPLGELIFGGEI